MVFDRSNGIYRSVIVALGGLILVGANAPSQNSPTQNIAAQANKSADKEKTVASAISRVSEALEAQNDKADPYEKQRNEREIRDLKAQEDSAYWAERMFWATVAALIPSLIGIVLVWTTFRETKKSNDIAQDHQRARLLPSAELGPTYHLSETKKVVLRCENIGLSPAYRAKCFALPVKEIPKLPPIDLIGGYERTVTVGEKNDLVEVGNFENDDRIVGMIEYDTIFGGPQHSYFCFGFEWSQQSKKWFAVSQIPETWPRDT